MSVTANSLSEDARIVLRLISKRPRPRLTYMTSDVLAMQPNHLAPHRGGEPAVAEEAGPNTPQACVAMDAQEVMRALDELSQDGGWLAKFIPRQRRVPGTEPRHAGGPVQPRPCRQRASSTAG